MEQKTEASQAVDSIPTWRERMAKAGLPYPGYKPDSYMEAEIADLRAALKAQPAPTEAAHGSFLVRVTPMNQEYADVHPELALEDALRVNPHGWPDGFQFEVVAAQGEDSARLDAMMHASWNLESFDMPTGGDDADIGWRVVEHHMAEPVRRVIAEVYEDNPRVAIDRARASAETGGVKP